MDTNVATVIVITILVVSAVVAIPLLLRKAEPNIQDEPENPPEPMKIPETNNSKKSIIAEYAEKRNQRDEFPKEQRGVKIVDIDIPFGRMVVIIFKWWLAAIPAAIIIWILTFIIMGLFGVSLIGLTQ
ncbi:hypothetical protein P4E94_19110 [Pontiellaceae bacterium B12219]|nr:hypothetical protein [Pontiellaceae bacterium B12219]